jgi:hypothetical protein
MRPSGVELRIDTLVLDGFPPTDGELVRRATEAELARLVAHGAGSTGPAAQPGSPQLIGRQIAERVHGRLSS